LSYITARDVFDRFDESVGPENWTVAYHELMGRTMCELSVNIEGAGWVTKTDGAGESTIEPEKGSISDAVKRAAVCWGVARDLYPAAKPAPAPAPKPVKVNPKFEAVAELKKEAAAQAVHFNLEPAQGKFVLIDAMKAVGIEGVDGTNFPGHLSEALESGSTSRTAMIAAIGLWEPQAKADDAFGSE